MKFTDMLKRTAAALAGVVMTATCFGLPMQQTVYAAQAAGESGQVGTLDAVTNLHWDDYSAATVAWDAVMDANYYAVTVTVYAPNGTKLLGAKETGTTATELDVQQEIHNVIGNAEYDYVMVTATVIAMKKQNDSIISESDLIISEYFQYLLVPRLPAPTNLLLSEDGTLRFKYIDDSIFYHKIKVDAYINGIAIPGCSHIYHGSTFKKENGFYVVNSDLIQRTYRKAVELGYIENGSVANCSFSMTTETNLSNWLSSDISATSNSIEYSKQYIKYPTPTDLVLSENGILNFKYSGELDGGSYKIIGYINGIAIPANDIPDLDDADLAYSYATKSLKILKDGDDCSVDIKYMATTMFNKAEEYYKYALNGNRSQADISFSVMIQSSSNEYFSSDESSISNTIKYSNFISVENLVLVPASPLVYLGKSYYLGKTIYPRDAHYKSIDWTSDNENIVTVDENGKITGVSVGTANITAAIDDATATVPVTVYEITSNIEDEEIADRIISTAGDIIDDIANKNNPNLSNTDIDKNSLGIIKNEIENAAGNGNDFWVNIKNEGRGLGHYKQYWDDPAFWEWYSALYEDNGWHFGWGNNVEYEMGYTDSSGEDHRIGSITEFDSEYGFYFEVSEDSEMEELKNGKKRIYNVIRFHDGGYDVVDIEILKNGKIKVLSDKYSDFVLVYKDMDCEQCAAEAVTLNRQENKPVISGEKNKVYVGFSADVSNGYTVEDYGLIYYNSGTVITTPYLTLENVNICGIKKAKYWSANISDIGYGVACVGFVKVKDETGYVTTLYTEELGSSFAKESEEAATNAVTFTRQTNKAVISGGEDKVYISFSASVSDEYTLEDYGLIYYNSGTVITTPYLTLENVGICGIHKTKDWSTNIKDNGYGVTAVGFVKVKDTNGYVTTLYTEELGSSFAKESEEAAANAVTFTRQTNKAVISGGEDKVYVGFSASVSDEYTLEDYGLIYYNSGNVIHTEHLTLENVCICGIHKTKDWSTNIIDNGYGVTAVGFVKVKDANGYVTTLYTEELGNSVEELSAITKKVTLTKQATKSVTSGGKNKVYCGFNANLPNGYTVTDYGLIYYNSGNVIHTEHLTLENVGVCGIQKAKYWSANITDIGYGVACVGFVQVKAPNGYVTTLYTEELGGSFTVVTFTRHANKAVKSEGREKVYCGFNANIADGYTVLDYGLVYYNTGTVITTPNLTLENVGICSIQKAKYWTALITDKGYGVTCVGFVKVKDSNGYVTTHYTDELGAKFTNLQFGFVSPNEELVEL